MFKMFKKFKCELVRSNACMMYHGLFNIRFYKLNNEIYSWLANNNIKYRYHMADSAPSRKNPIMVFYHYGDLVFFKISFPEVIYK